MHATGRSVCPVACARGRRASPQAKDSRRAVSELWDAINGGMGQLAAWDEDLTAAKLECAYRLLMPVMGLINDKNGGNNFTLPHTGIRKSMRDDGWEI